MKVARIRSTEEMQCIKNTWRSEIYSFLMLQSEKISLSDVGVNCPRPVGLDTERLSDVLRTDPLNRFQFSVGSKGNSFVQIRLDDEMNSRLCEEWRNRVGHYMHSTNCGTLSFSDIGSLVRRPALLSEKLKDVLLTDPQHRFQITGDQVKLVKRAYVAARTRTSSANKCDMSLCSQDTDAGWTMVGSTKHGPMSHSKHTQSLSQPKPWTAPSKAAMRQPQPSSDALWMDSHAQPPENFAERQEQEGTQEYHSFDCSLQSEHHSTDLCSFAPNSREVVNIPSFLGPPGFNTVPPSLSSLFVESDASWMNELISQHQERDQQHHDSSAMGSSFVQGHGHAVSAGITTATVNPKKLMIENWFPLVFEGFPATIIESFVSQFIDEAYICANDLIVAQSLNQLSFEYLREEYGFKKGHYNRLMTSLADLIAKQAT
jgi:hypothetical protein